MRLFFAAMLCCISLLASPALAASIPVVVSIAPQAYIMQRLAGELVAVTTLVTPGADPHSFEPSPSQVRACASAKLYFTIGLPFEDIWGPRIAGVAPNLRQVSMIMGITRLPMQESALTLQQGNTPQSTAHADSPTKHKNEHEHDHEATGQDTHVWLSPSLVRAMIPNLVRELTRALPEQAAFIKTNAETLSAELEQLDYDLAQQFASVPEAKRVFLSFHPAWQYFAMGYGLREYSIESEGKEPSPKAMKAIIDIARKHNINTVFIEPQFPKAAAKAVAANLNASLIEVNPLAYDIQANLRIVAQALLQSFGEKRK